MRDMTINYVVSLLIIYVAVASSKSECDRDDCPGPLKFYRDIGCQPVYKKYGNRCPIRFDCGLLDNRPNNKCYAFGEEYSIDESLRTEGHGCFFPCFCAQQQHKTADWICAVPGALPPLRDGCYRPRDAAKCFPEAEVCFENPQDIPTCEVDGKIIKAGDYFIPEAEPKLDCWCGPGYSGKNILPFCKDRTEDNCGTDLRYWFYIKSYCAPLYNLDQSPAFDCNYQWRCYEAGDKVIPREQIPDAPKHPGNFKCQFGPTLKLRIGDSINRVINGNCIKCSCNVPPFLSCTKFPETACSQSSA